MANWIMSANPMMYNHKAAFDDYGFIDWNQTRNFSVDDYVYIYCSKGVSKIQYLAKVIRINMAPEEKVDDHAYWKTSKVEIKKRYMRLQLVQFLNCDGLEYSELVKHGMRYAPQSPCLIKEDLQKYLDCFFERKGKQ